MRDPADIDPEDYDGQLLISRDGRGGVHTDLENAPDRVQVSRQLLGIACGARMQRTEDRLVLRFDEGDLTYAIVAEDQLAETLYCQRV